MTISWKLALFLVMFLCGVFKAKAQCMFAQCVCAETFMICRDRSSNITTPLNISADLSNALELPNNVLPPSLTEISFMNSHISNIGDKAFDDSATTLQQFTLANCPITSISDTFLHLKILNSFSISDTNIQNWNPPAMINIGRTVETMLLSNVGITSWPSWLSNFSSLTELTFEKSLISSIPDGAFDLMSNNLITLTLTNNLLTSVPKALSVLTNLQILYLEQDLISNVTWLPPSKNLRVLSLGSNIIYDSQHLKDALLPFAQSLTDLDLHDNRLTSLPDLNFLVNVGRLDLSNNRLSNDVLGSLPVGVYDLSLQNNMFPFIPTALASVQSLSTLDIQSNLITEIRGTDFAMTFTEIDLDNNQISELDDGSFPANNKINILSLNDNPIVAITPGAFKPLTQLSSLSMVNSRLTRMPIALSSLKGLLSLDLSGSTDLICTCEEQSLEKFITVLGLGGVVGQCGLTSIYTFYSFFSPNCPN